MKRRYRYCIGIDPGVTTGMAIWSPETKRLLAVTSATILKAMASIKSFKDNQHTRAGAMDAELLIRIEDPRLRKWIPRQKTESAERGRNRGAGSVMRDAQIWQEFCEQEAIAYELVAPKNNKTKVKAAYFQAITGWKDETNEHGRDAAMLVVGI